MTGQDYEAIIAMMVELGINIERVRQGGGFIFPFYIYDDFDETPIEVLELSERSKNALMRSGIKTLADVANTISGRSDLFKIRNCGRKSISEIMEKLFLYQVMRRKPEDRKAYLQECVRKSVKIYEE